MRIANEVNENNEVVEKRLSTIVRRKKLAITAESINNILCVIDHPSEPTLNLIDEDLFKILRPGEPSGPYLLPLLRCLLFTGYYSTFTLGILFRKARISHILPKGISYS